MPPFPNSSRPCGTLRASSARTRATLASLSSCLWFSSAATASVHLGGEGCHCLCLGGDGIYKLLHHRLVLFQFLVDTCSHRTCRIIGIVGEDRLSIHAFLELYDVLGL